jgi:hypothetical protein
MARILPFCACETTQSEEIDRLRNDLIEVDEWAARARTWIEKAVSPAGNATYTEGRELLEAFPLDA